MKIYYFCHSVISDWNHDNAHFLRGIISSLHFSGHNVEVFEPKDSWSLKNLLMEKGRSVIDDFRKYFPFHSPAIYSEKNFEPSDYLYDADLVIVHEWNNPEIVKKIGDYKKINSNFILLFHDTNHRSVTVPEEMSRYDLSKYDGVLVPGDEIRRAYLKNRWARNVWTWHDAADDRIFHPVISEEREGDLVWIGNWGDEERTRELREYIIEPVIELGLRASFYGVRYPSSAVKMLKKARIKYKGWLPNYRMPEVFGRYGVTVHVPGRYAQKLPGIPTIRPFEAMACGIPLVCSPWNDSERLFTPGKDFLIASNGCEMKKHLWSILNNVSLARALSSSGLETIRNRHTCDHRVEELMKIVSRIMSGKVEHEFSGMSVVH